MSLIHLDKVTYFYPERKTPALSEISLDIHSGDYSLLIGPSGCGKSTLLQTIVGVVPHATGGRIRGKIYVQGVDVLRSPEKIRGKVGLTLQDPETQLISLFVEDELVFGPENLCLPKEEVLRRLDWALERARLKGLERSFVYTLSGGQKQRVAMASVLAMKPQILLMDGPITNLDPEGAKEVLNFIYELRESANLDAAVIAANKIDDLLPLANRIVVMDEGKVILDGSPEWVILENSRTLRDLGVFVPEIGLALSSLKDKIKTDYQRLIIPKSLKEAKEVFASFNLPKPQIICNSINITANNVVEVKNVSFSYDSNVVLKDLSLEVKKGEFLAVVGQNGSGKTTLMSLIAGLRLPQSGEVLVSGKDTRKVPPLGVVGYVFQYPDHQFVAQTTVEDELALGLKAKKLPQDEIDKCVEEMLGLFGFQEKRKIPPYTLSVGEKRRLSVATMLIIHPEILILDEPTTGLDLVNTTSIMEILRKQVYEEGITLIQVTHDMEQVAEYAERVVLLDSRNIVFDGTPREMFLRDEVLRQGRLRAPPIADLAKQLWSGTDLPITVKEFLQEGFDAFN